MFAAVAQTETMDPTYIAVEGGGKAAVNVKVQVTFIPKRSAQHFVVHMEQMRAYLAQVVAKTSNIIK